MKAQRLLAIAASVTTLGSLGVAVAAVQPAHAGPAPSARAAAAALASIKVQPNFIKFRGGPTSGPPTTAECRQVVQVPCYSPLQIENAYGTPALYSNGVTGAGQTIAIVDSFGSPTIRQDLAAFDKAYGLPAPPSFKIIQPAGKVPPYDGSGLRSSWAGETSLDVEYSHAMAPGANILLVETPTAETEGVGGFPQIVQAEEYVIKHHLADVITQSFGATEESFASAQAIARFRTPYEMAAAAGITVLASTADDGATNVVHSGNAYYDHPVVAWPSTDPLVTAVGGTQLHLNAAGQRTSPDTVWNDSYNKETQEYIYGDSGPNPLGTGGGKSVIFARPSYQKGVASITGYHRGVPDISMSAACNGNVIVRLSYAPLQAGFYSVCGTSEASPEFSGIVALADQVAGHQLGTINPALYAMSAAHDPGIVDVTSGNNNVSFTQDGQRVNVRGYSASAGYDLASGVGTIWAPDFVPELAHQAG
jgi:subtilase family serine protease